MLLRPAALTAAFLIAAPGALAALQTDHTTGTALFEINSNARVSLHHLLIAWASADAGEWPRYAQPITERQDLDGLTPEDRETWRGALDVYAATVGRSHVFDEGLRAVRDLAAGDVDVRLDDDERALAEALERALPVYQEHWWPTHHEVNRAWASETAELLESYEGAIAERLEGAYGARWPTERVPVDAVPYANDVGAYSTGGRITIASADPENQSPQSLELVFHEASHVDELEMPLRDRIQEAYDAEGSEPPGRLWHDMIFLTTGEVTAIVLESQGREYQHYGHATGLYRRGERWPPQLAAFEEHWKPYLREGGGVEARSEALRGMARALPGG